ncbi:hypothetical protein TUM17563_57250 [Klebsiella oxytoca]|nr:hypothetical protein TUM17563_57250 [Klebsiella oxytoca]
MLSENRLTEIIKQANIKALKKTSLAIFFVNQNITIDKTENINKVKLGKRTDCPIKLIKMNFLCFALLK